MTKKRVLFFAPTPPPFHGASYAAQMLLESDFSGEFHVAHIDCRFADRIQDLEKATLRKFFLLFKFAALLVFRSLTLRPDLIILCPASNPMGFLKDSFYIWISSVLLGKRLIFWMHGNGLKRLHDGAGNLFGKYIRMMMNKGSALVPVGRTLARLNDNFFTDEAKIFPIPYGIPGRPLDHDKTPRTTVRITYFSNMAEEKGWKTVFEAAKILLGGYPNLEFCFYGQPTRLWPYERLHDFFVESGRPTRIVYHGPVYGKAKERALSEADIFCFPTYYDYEALPLSVLEFMRCARPIVATAQGCIAEAVEEGRGGFLIAPNDVRQLVDKLEILINDENLRKQMGDFNRAKFEEEFVIEKNIERWKNLVRTL